MVTLLPLAGLLPDESPSPSTASPPPAGTPSLAARLRRLARWAVAAGCLAGVGPVVASDGVTPESVTFIQTADLTSSRAALARELNAGINAYFNHVNDQGGVHGRRIAFKTEDDGYDVERTRRIVEDHVQRNDTFAFMSFIGTANALAALPVLNAAKVPLIAPLSGAAQLREPYSRQVFHIRASYAQEVEKMVEHVLTLGIGRVAVFYDDDEFGRDVLKAAEGALAKRQLTLAAAGKVARGADNVDDALNAIAAAKPQVVICGSFGKSLVSFINRMNALGAKPTYYALSFFTAGASIKQLGGQARGIGVTQVMPKPSADGIPLVREFRSLMEKHSPAQPLTPISLEGFVTAKVIVEGLRRAGPNLTRPRFLEAMESFKDLDLGSLRLSYSPTNHTGLKFVEISVVAATGQVLR